MFEILFIVAFCLSFVGIIMAICWLSWVLTVGTKGEKVVSWLVTLAALAVVIGLGWVGYVHDAKRAEELRAQRAPFEACVQACLGESK